MGFSDRTAHYLKSEVKRVYYGLDVKLNSDIKAIRRMYKKQLGCEPDIINPRRFTEKLQWLKLFYRNDDLPVCSDKYESEKYLKKFGYEELKPKILAVAEAADEIDFSTLPKRFALKASHGSGWNIICKDKSKLDEKYARLMMKSWLKQDLYIYGREWNYRYQTPRIIVEEFIEAKVLIDYKFMCFDGKIEYMQINHDEDGIHCVDFYNGDWNMLDMTCGIYPTAKKVLPLPEKFREMSEIALKLSSGHPFMRVDLYDVDGRIYFGEMTFFPGSGYWKIAPLKYDFEMGDKLTLPEPNYNLELYKKLKG